MESCHGQSFPSPGQPPAEATQPTELTPGEALGLPWTDLPLPALSGGRWGKSCPAGRVLDPSSANPPRLCLLFNLPLRRDG